MSIATLAITASVLSVSDTPLNTLTAVLMTLFIMIIGAGFLALQVYVALPNIIALCNVVRSNTISKLRSSTTSPSASAAEQKPWPPSFSSSSSSFTPASPSASSSLLVESKNSSASAAGVELQPIDTAATSAGDKTVAVNVDLTPAAFAAATDVAASSSSSPSSSSRLSHCYQFSSSVVDCSQPRHP